MLTVFITAIRTAALFICLTDDCRATGRKREVFAGPPGREEVEQDLPLQLLTLSGVGLGWGLGRIGGWGVSPTQKHLSHRLCVGGSAEQMQIPWPSQSLFRRNVGTHI